MIETRLVQAYELEAGMTYSRYGHSHLIGRVESIGDVILVHWSSNDAVSDRFYRHSNVAVVVQP